MKIIGALICVLTLMGAVWFFSRTPSVPDTIPTPPQPIPLFAQGLKIEAKTTDVEVEIPQSSPPPSTINRSSQLTNEEIEQTLLQYQRQYQNCWTQGLKNNPELSGRILIHITLANNGKVTDVEIPQTDIQDATMIQCLKSVIARIPFREFEGHPITLSLPLDFSS